MDAELEQKAGDYLFDTPKTEDGQLVEAQYVKFNIVSKTPPKKKILINFLDCKLWWFRNLCL